MRTLGSGMSEVLDEAGHVRETGLLTGLAHGQRRVAGRLQIGRLSLPRFEFWRRHSAEAAL